MIKYNNTLSLSLSLSLSLTELHFGFIDNLIAGDLKIKVLFVALVELLMLYCSLIDLPGHYPAPLG